MHFSLDLRAWPKKLIVLFFVAALSVGVPLCLLYHWIYEGGALKLETVFVVETEHIKPAEIREYLRDDVGKPLYGLDLHDMAKRLSKHPWLKTATLRRAPPHTLVVEVSEKKPIAVAAFGRLTLIDEEGGAIKFIRHDELGNWPLLRVKHQQKLVSLAATALSSYETSSKRAGAIREVQADEAGALIILFESGLRAELGSDKFEEKWQKLDAALNTVEGNQNKLTYIYLGNYPNPQQVAVQFERKNELRGYANGSPETR